MGGKALQACRGMLLWARSNCTLQFAAAAGGKTLQPYKPLRLSAGRYCRLILACRHVQQNLNGWGAGEVVHLKSLNYLEFPFNFPVRFDFKMRSFNSYI